MGPCRVRSEKKVLWGFFNLFFCLIHPDEVQCSRNVLIECCPVGICSPSGQKSWRTGE